MRAHQECKVGAKHRLNILRPKFSNYIAIQHSVDVLLRSLINMCLKYGGLVGWPATSWRRSSTLANVGQKPNQNWTSRFAYKPKLSNLWLLLALQKRTFKNTSLDSVKLAKATNGVGFRLMENLLPCARHSGLPLQYFAVYNFSLGSVLAPGEAEQVPHRPPEWSPGYCPLHQWLMLLHLFPAS